MDSQPVPKERLMKFPYTITAKVVSFPYKFYYKHAWMTKWWLISLGVTSILYWKIGKLSYSPENVAKWAEIRRKAFSGEH